MSGEPPAVLIDRLTVRYGARTAIAELTLRAAPGEVVALTGPNGSGKSTLLRTVLGLQAATSGSVRVRGDDVADLSLLERARRLAWAPQEEPVGENVPVIDYVRFGRYPHVARFARETESDEAAVEHALRQVDFWEGRSRGIRELSGGERQRVRLARALAQETPVLLLDEPTAYLDIGHQLEILGRTRAIAREESRCVLVALHDLNLAARFADRIVVLSHGRLVAHGTPPEVLSPELLADVWGVVAELRRDPRTHLPYLIPVLPADRIERATAPGRRWMARVHVVAGGGAATELIPRLAREGFEVSVGAVHLFDTDAELGERLGVAMAVETPFAPLSPPVVAHLEGLLEAANAIVVAPVPAGPANLANWRTLAAWSGRRPIALLPVPSDGSWDFTGGEATRIRADLIAAGAAELPSVDAVVDWLRQRVVPRAPAPAGAA